MIELARRGLRLWRTNPAQFKRRLAFIMEAPVRNVGSLMGAPRRYRRVQQSYKEWVLCREQVRTGPPASDGSPLLSIIMPVYNTDEALLTAAIESVLAQSYPSWELCVADDASNHPAVRRTLDHYSQRDPRVRVVYREQQGHIGAASNTALEMASGEFIVLLDHDDVLTPDALHEVAAAITRDPTVDFVYSDEDKLDLDGERVEPFFKPAWSPTLLTTCNYITHLAALRRSLVLEVGGFRPETAGSQDHDLFLRVAERARAIAHVPLVLYSWRKSPTSTAGESTAKPYAIDAARLARLDAIARRGHDAWLEPAHLSGLYIVRHRVTQPVSISLIVVGDRWEWRAALDMPGITVVDLHFLGAQQLPPMPHDPPTVARIDQLTGDYLVCIDAGSKPIGPESLLALLEHAQYDHVAVAGGMTLYRPTRFTLQAGIAIGDGGQPAYAYHGLPRVPHPNFYLNVKDLPHEVSAVYSGCCGMRRSIWHEFGGSRHGLPPVLAITDLCLQALRRGYDNVFTPLAQYQTEDSLPPIPPVTTYDWAWSGFADPFWNPNLTPTTEDGLPFRCRGDRRSRVRQAADTAIRDVVE